MIAIRLAIVLLALPAFSRDSPVEIVSFIDAEFASKWRSKKLQPSPTCSDHEFLRRAYLDINGTIPPAAQARAFTQDSRPDKRARLVERLLGSTAHAQYESILWGNILVGRGTKAKALEQLTLRNWLRQQFAANAPFDRIARALLTASGNSRQNPPAQWTLHHKQKPEQLASATSRIFLGTQIQCAQCHDHPFDVWEQRDFYGLAAFFGRLEEQQRIFGRTVKEKASGEVRLGGLPDGDIIPPTFLWGDDAVAAKESPRVALADWMLSPQNAQFAKAITNRIWAHYLGRGFVNPIDDFCDTNTPVYPKVLERLAQYFSDSGYDLRALARVITATRAYQLSSRATRSNVNDSRYFSKMPLRRLSAEQLLASVVISTGIRSDIADNPLFKLLLGGVQQEFVFVFANMDEVTEVTEFQGTIAQALLMMNSQHIANIVDFKLLDPLTHTLFRLSPSAQIDQLYWHTLSRAPSEAERSNFLSYYDGVTELPKRLEISEDIYWALLNSAEFAFNWTSMPDRREFIRLGLGGPFGAWISTALPTVADSAKNDKAMIVLWMNGGASQTDTFDPKPGHANAGSFKAIGTSAGSKVQICEHLPRIAELMHHIGLVRSMVSTEGSHERGRFLMHTGYRPLGATAYPSFGSVLAAELGSQTANLPNFVSLRIPSYGPGFLGVTHAPFHVNLPGNVANSKPSGINDERFSRRLNMLKSLERGFVASNRGPEAREHYDVYARGVSFMRSKRLNPSFALKSGF